MARCALICSTTTATCFGELLTVFFGSAPGLAKMFVRSKSLLASLPPPVLRFPSRSMPATSVSPANMAPSEVPVTVSGITTVVLAAPPAVPSAGPTEPPAPSWRVTP